MLKQIASLDMAALHYINSTLSSRWLDWVMPVITYLGSVYFVLLLSLVFSLIKKPRHMAMLGIVYGANSGTFELIKHLVGRERPFLGEDVILRVPGILTNPGEVAWGMQSFPSGHAATAVMLAVVLSYYYKSHRGIFYSLAAVVGFSRVYLGVHYPSDVLAGFISGIVTARLCLGNARLRRLLLEEKSMSA